VLKIFGTLIVSLIVWAGFLLLFQNGVIPIDKVGNAAVGVWLSKSFIPSSLIVIFVTLVAAGIWFWISLKSSDKSDCHEFVKYWWGILMIPLATIALVTYLNLRETSNVTVYVMLSYIIHVILIYWVGTSISSAGMAKYILPGSRGIRRLVSSVGIPL
jgi:hypothetical protein